MAADKKRGAQTVRDMVLSLAVIGLAAGVAYLFIPHDEGKDPVRTVNYQVELSTAQRGAPYPVAAPEGLSKRWRATSVDYEPTGKKEAAWHLGFISPDEEYVAVEQSNGRPKPFVKDVTQGATKTGKSVRIDGVEWTRYEGDKYDALVRTESEVTTVVTGTAGFGQLKQMASALKAERTGPEAEPSADGPGEPSAEGTTGEQV
ncbi:DUF4245 domain-containing protein [Streptomyces sp. N2-109]|uniref:DUF4245 domain-containing protein n=1 Tax=Streptomyces gossypii TaxID=2883101 RepID=A0ABT2JW43_9ACTN|nr:DUF4245 domain-containing protein [Streptomyces gossypii]MCT2591956.1 DUF4245 domain-containing protein [Streptomyces gossypii]